jgi:hypothetical protein
MYESQINSSIKIDDPNLYGNEAADDENLSKLAGYYVPVPDSNNLFGLQNKFAIIRAKKGMGKSALLRYLHYTKLIEANTLSIYLKESDFYIANEKYPFPENIESGSYVHIWQQRICFKIAYEIGKLIKIPTNYMEYCLKFSSDQIGNFLDKNLLKGIFDHLNLKLTEIEISKKDVEISNCIQLISDYSKTEHANTIWIMIDDIDASFVYSNRNSLIITSFINACRNIIRDNNNIYIRCSMRTDVLSSVVDDNETSDKTSQYYFDIKWSQKEMKNIIAKRCSTYLLARFKDENIKKYIKQQNSDYFISLMFSGKFYWAGYRPTNLLNVYSAGRPRWALQLMRMAGESSISMKNGKITYGEIKNQMYKYGANRVLYICAEHKHQCNHLQELIMSFTKQDDIYKYSDLKVLIAEILKKINDEFDEDKLMIDRQFVKKEKIIIELLYKVGFINKKEYREGSKKLIKYEEEPLALSNITGIEETYWEIHPAFRYYLQLNDTRNGEEYTVDDQE